MNLFPDLEKMRNELDSLREEYQGILNEYKVIAAEAELYREHGTLFEKWKEKVLAPERTRIAVSRMSISVDDRDAHLQHEGAFDEVKRLMDRGDTILGKELQLMTDKAKLAQRIAGLDEQIKQEALKQAKRHTE
jgi:hypothetical protein